MPTPAGGRILALGQAVDLIVEQQDLAVEVAAQDVHRVVAADAQCVAVAGDDPYVELGIGELDAGGEGRRAAVDGVEAVGRHVIRKAARAADAADEHGLFTRHAEVGHGPLHRLQHRIIAAAGAPAHFLVARPVLGGGDGRHFVHQWGLSQMTISTIGISRMFIGNIHRFHSNRSIEASHRLCAALDRLRHQRHAERNAEAGSRPGRCHNAPAAGSLAITTFQALRSRAIH